MPTCPEPVSDRTIAAHTLQLQYAILTAFSAHRDTREKAIVIRPLRLPFQASTLWMTRAACTVVFYRDVPIIIVNVANIRSISIIQ